ncbi:MAG: phosphoesterase [Thermoanaerobaculia bacterium]
MSEEVMVVHRSDLAAHIDGRKFDFITTETESILRTIETKHFFIARPTAEVSPQYKQIIPYVVIRNGEDFYVLTRTSKQTESRLHHKRSLGIGGHINPDTPTVLGGLTKELDEEVSVPEPYDLRFIGILNDDTTDVGSVHLGAVYILDTPSRDVTVRETDKMSGEWRARGDLGSLREAMETWSQLVYDHWIL